MRLIVLSLALMGLLAPRLACGQSASPTIRISVLPIQTWQLGDTAIIAYEITNDAQSTARVFTFDVPRSGPLLWATPNTRPWAVLTTSGHLGVVEWVSLDHSVMTAGAASPRLEYAGLGVVGIVKAWAMPYVPVATEGDVMSSTDTEPRPVFVTTLGVVSAPIDQSASALVDYLTALVAQSCELDWVSDPGTCTSLSQKLAAVSTSLGLGDTTAARKQLGAFDGELDAQRDKHVSENAYWLLKANTSYVRERL